MGSLDDVPLDVEDTHPTVTVEKQAPAPDADLDFLETGNALTIHHNGNTHRVPLSCPERARVESAEERVVQVETEADALYARLNETRADLWGHIAELREENMELRSAHDDLRRDLETVRDEARQGSAPSLWQRFLGWLHG